MSVRATHWAWEKGRELDLGVGELLLLVRIADHADNDGVCWPGNRHLADYCCCDESTVRRNMRRLEERGLLIRERQNADEGRGREFDRILLQMPSTDQARKSPARKSPTKRASTPGPSGHSGPDQACTGARVYVENRQEPSGTTPLAPRYRGGNRKRDQDQDRLARETWAAEHFPTWDRRVVLHAIDFTERRGGATVEAVAAQLERGPYPRQEAAA